MFNEMNKNMLELIGGIECKTECRNGDGKPDCKIKACA